VRAQQLECDLGAIAEGDDGETSVPQRIGNGDDVLCVGDGVVACQIHAFGLPGTPAGGEALTRRRDEPAALQRRRDGQIPALIAVQPRPAEAGPALLHEHQIAERPEWQHPLGIAGKRADTGRAGPARDEENGSARGFAGGG